MWLKFLNDTFDQPVAAALFRLGDKNPRPIRRWRTFSERRDARPVQIKQRCETEFMLASSTQLDGLSGALPIAAPIAMQHSRIEVTELLETDITGKVLAAEQRATFIIY
jgi:hypothetical protein